jgi:hypothetical protein
MLLAHFRVDSASQTPCRLGHSWSARPTLVVPTKGRRKGASSAYQLDELDRIKDNATELKWINSPDFMDLPEQSGLKMELNLMPWNLECEFFGESDPGPIEEFGEFKTKL